jgi:hypothetical protein
MSFMNTGQVLSGLLVGHVLKVVVAKYEDDTLRTYKVMIKVKVCVLQRQQ